MTSVDFVFGIDGGGTGCRVVACDTLGQELARASGGPANYFTDPDAALRNILCAVDDVIAQLPAGSFKSDSCVAHAGLAGVLGERDSADVAAAIPLGVVTVTDDGVTSVAGALGRADGVLVSVGTGSFVAAQRGGELQILGGWGAQLGDQASGCWLGMQALRRAFLVQDGLLPSSHLIVEIMDQCGGSRSAVLQFIKAARPVDYAALAPRVIAAAQAEDRHGQEIMQEGAQYLVSCLKVVNLSDQDMLCLSGGIGAHYAAYFGAELQSRMRPPLGSTLDGALRLALQQAGRNAAAGEQ